MNSSKDLGPDAELSLPAFNVVTGSYDPRSLKFTLLEFKTMRYGVKYTSVPQATAVDRFERSMLGDIRRGLAARDAAWHNTEPGQKGPLRDILDMSEYTGMVFGTVGEVSKGVHRTQVGVEMSSKFGGPAAGSQPAELEGEEAREAREAREEREALGKIVRAFKAYGEHAEWEVARWERNYERMPERHRALLPHVPQKCARARQCVKSNEHFITAMLAAFDSENGPVPPHLADASRAAECGEGQALHVTPGDIDKVHYVLKNLMRDWSEDGAVERAQSYGRVLAEIKRIFADW
eukprot:jgi/Tetstr1/432687/TSEL_022054.t2